MKEFGGLRVFLEKESACYAFQHDRGMYRAYGPLLFGVQDAKVSQVRSGLSMPIIAR